MDAAQARPARIYYLGEAKVAYLANGRQQIAWLPATARIDDRAWIAFELSHRLDDTAQIQWNPADPTHGVATLHLSPP